jgi:hypothetical protein
VDIRIDTLRLQAGGMDPDTARRFARLVAERLDAALASWPAAVSQEVPDAEVPGVAVPRAAEAGLPAPRRAPPRSLRIAIQAPASGSQESLATHVAAEVSRALRAASVPARRPGSAPPADPGARPAPGPGPQGRR